MVLYLWDEWELGGCAGAGSLQGVSGCHLGVVGPQPSQDNMRGVVLADVQLSFSAPQELSKRFTAIRKTKGDGNCFYRALGYSYLESLLGKNREILR